VSLLRCHGCGTIRPCGFSATCPLCNDPLSFNCRSGELVAEVAHLPDSALAELHRLLTTLEGEAHVWN
jgi:hypothetical protein